MLRNIRISKGQLQLLSIKFNIESLPLKTRFLVLRSISQLVSLSVDLSNAFLAAALLTKPFVYVALCETIERDVR